MKRPTRVKVGYLTFPVKWRKGLSTPEGEEVNGYVHFGSTEKPHIAVNTDGGNDFAETLLHEVVHAVMQDRDLDALLDRSEEMFVASFSRGLLAAFRENRGLAEWLVNPDG